MTEIHDPNTFANINDIASSHFSLTWSINFDAKEISGKVVHKMKTKKDNISTIVLDTRDLTINKCTVDGQEAKFELGESSPFGSALTITPAKAIEKAGSEVTVEVDYKTSPSASGLQWLEPAQTADKKLPYMYSQFQAIHARSGIPLQDTPAVKITYDAVVTVAEPLVALMSALAKGEPAKADGKVTYTYEQLIPMPSYLVAIAVGGLESREIGPRSRVWSEPSQVEAAAYEFADTEKFLATGEDIVGPYVWGRYDLLVLPPSFAYGGMENVNLTFVTPTLIAGDRSLANVIIHEESHSWTGNLVTNLTWEHFWLNEGFTVFLERAIMGRVYGGKAHRDFAAIIGRKALRDAVAHYGEDHAYTALAIKLDGVDPDDAFSSIPYEKGFTFLDYLQSLVGGSDTFEPFLKKWIQSNAKGSVTTEQFQAFFTAEFPEAAKKVDWKTWFHGTGMPPVLPDLDTSLAEAATNLSAAWRKFDAEGGDAPAKVELNARQFMLFLDDIGDADALKHSTLEALDKVFDFTASKNAEIRFRWYQLGIKAGFDPLFAEAAKFLTQVGRMKFCRPLFRSLHKSEKGKQLAIDTFTKHRSSFHPIAEKMIAADLKL